MSQYPLYAKAKKLLFKEYEDAFKIVQNSSYHKTYVNEKIRHSLQVSGVGNGILLHEPYFLKKDEAFIDLSRTAILLHDIYRFREIRLLFETGKKIDHSVLGSELLSQTEDFNDILITLPIKHHGHMIECMYEDESYLNQNDTTKDQIKHIAFAVRDADKIANWYLFAHEWMTIQEVWLKYPYDFSETQAQINEELWWWFEHTKVAPNTLRQTNAETIISILCWLFDINYNYSIAFCKYHNLFSKLCDIFRKFKVDESQISQIYQIMKDYTFKTFHIEI